MTIKSDQLIKKEQTVELVEEHLLMAPNKIRKSKNSFLFLFLFLQKFIFDDRLRRL